MSSTLDDLDDAREDLKELKKYEKRAYKNFSAVVGLLLTLVVGAILTNNGAFATLLIPSFALGAWGLVDLYQVRRSVSVPWPNAMYSHEADKGPNIDMKKKIVRRLERQYQQEMMKSA
jgi:hypothetical protein